MTPLVIGEDGDVTICLQRPLALEYVKPVSFSIFTNPIVAHFDANWIGDCSKHRTTELGEVHELSEVLQTRQRRQCQIYRYEFPVELQMEYDRSRGAEQQSSRSIMCAWIAGMRESMSERGYYLELIQGIFDTVPAVSQKLFGVEFDCQE